MPIKVLLDRLQWHCHISHHQPCVADAAAVAHADITVLGDGVDADVVVARCRLRQELETAFSY